MTYTCIFSNIAKRKIGNEIILGEEPRCEKALFSATQLISCDVTDNFLLKQLLFLIRVSRLWVLL